MLAPDQPTDAQDIVAAYLRCLSDHDAELYPCSVRDLPYPKTILRPAFKTTVATLVALGRMTEELREYLQIAYVSLADYIEPDHATLLHEYVNAGHAMATDSRLMHENPDALRRITRQGQLAGQIASAISREADSLRLEFELWTHFSVPARSGNTAAEA